MTLAFTKVGLSPYFVDYQEAWDHQRLLHADVLAGRAPSTVLLLEHAAVYTAGKRTEDHERPFDGTPVIAVDRGGKLTWHGPGQLVGYPILALRDPHAVRQYVQILEEILIRSLAQVGVTGTRVEGRAGIWIEADAAGPTRKIAAIGIRVHEGVTMHGFALNCNNDLAPYTQIIACGITDAGTTTIQAETGRNLSPADLAPIVADEFRRFEDALVAARPEPGAHAAESADNAADLAPNAPASPEGGSNDVTARAAQLRQAEGAVQ
jgi:lipoyl(octanoyl) transferase